MTPPALSPHEGRVLGVLVEKQRTVPDSYPLTLNALVDGCNQKTSREPVLSLTESEARQALDALKGRSMVLETSGGRVMRYAHNVERALALPSQSVALLATLLLRGPQTAGELRLNADRLHRFADISAVEAFLAELAGRPAGALVAELPRTPGTRETRWMELLSGSTATIGAATRIPGAPPVAPAATRSGAPPSGADAAAAREAIAGLRNDVAGLRDEFAALREAIAALRGAGR